MSKFFVLIVLSLTVGCVHRGSFNSRDDMLLHPPLPHVFNSIAEEDYVLGENDCSNMSAKYFWHLIAAGYDANIVIIPPLSGGEYSHSVVYVNGLYCDPANNIYDHDIGYFEGSVTTALFLDRIDVVSKAGVMFRDGDLDVNSWETQ